MAYIRINTAELIAPSPSPQKATVTNAMKGERSNLTEMAYSSSEETARKIRLGTIPTHLEKVPEIEEAVWITK